MLRLQLGRSCTRECHVGKVTCLSNIEAGAHREAGSVLGDGAETHESTEGRSERQFGADFVTERRHGRWLM